MHTIDIYAFRDYDVSSMYEYLNIQGEATYTIISHKFAVAPYSNNFDLALQYLSVLYIGEQLASLSPDFSYLVPAPQSSESFSFKLTTPDNEALARVLVHLAASHRSGAAFADYEDDQDIFWDKVFKGDLVPVCYGLYHIACRYRDADPRQSY